MGGGGGGMHVWKEARAIWKISVPSPYTVNPKLL